MSMKNSDDTIGIRTRDLPACSAVPQPTAPSHTPMLNALPGEVSISRAVLVTTVHLSSLIIALALHTLVSVTDLLGCALRCLSSASILQLSKELHHIHTCFRDIVCASYITKRRRISGAATHSACKNLIIFSTSTFDSIS